jgi:uncharacterized protein (UPF0276 family)
MLPATGYALREANQPYVGNADWNAVEVDFQRAAHPLRQKAYLDGLAFDYVSIHALEISICSPDPPERAYLEALVEVASENGAVAITDHLGFAHARRDGHGAGHVMTPPLTPAALDATCRNIDFVQRQFGDYQLFLENLAHFFVLKGTIDEATFFQHLFRRTGCGLLLDVTNVYANQQNFGTNAAEFIETILATAPSVQIHLAGGFYDEPRQRYIDSHSEPIPEDVWELYRQAVKQAGDRLEAVFIERDWNYPSAEGWASEVARARAIAAEVASSCVARV